MSILLNRIFPFIASLTLGFASVWVATLVLNEPQLKIEETVNTQTNTTLKIESPVRGQRLLASGVDSDEEVESVWRDFQSAIAENNVEKAASLVNYPLNVNFTSDQLKKNSHKIASRSGFERDFNKIFDQSVKNFIAKTTSNDLWGSYWGIATPRGEIWIGVYCIGPQKHSCQSGHEVKIRTIYGNAIGMFRTDIDSKIQN